MQLETLFTEMADALRGKEETTDKISAESFPQRIKDLKVLDTLDATATADDIVAGKIAYANGKRVIGTVIENGRLEYIPSEEEQIIPAGKTSGGIVKAINSEEVIINPTTEEQIKEGLFNKVKVEGIKTQDLKITPTTEEQKFTGLFKNVTVEPADGGLDTSDATATAGDILKDKIAYVNGEKVTGTLEVSSGGGGNYNAKLDASSQTTLNLASAITEIDVLDCSSVTTLKSAFASNTSIKSINKIIAPNVTIATSLFNKCSNLVTAPEIDTSNFTEMNGMFTQCSKLVNVPVYDWSNATTLWNIFLNCGRLSDESLNNILAMCLTVTDKYTDEDGVKLLKNIGLSSVQLGRCMSLPNWQAVLNAGWTRGD